MERLQSKFFENLMTAKEVGAELRVSTKTVYEWARRGLIPHLKLGRHLRFRPYELDEWLRKKGANYGSKIYGPRIREAK